MLCGPLSAELVQMVPFFIVILVIINTCIRLTVSNRLRYLLNRS